MYSTAVLITALDRTSEPPRMLSTSSMPGLMTRMLETLDVHDGNRGSRPRGQSPGSAGPV